MTENSIGPSEFWTVVLLIAIAITVGQLLGVVPLTPDHILTMVNAIVLAMMLTVLYVNREIWLPAR